MAIHILSLLGRAGNYLYLSAPFNITVGIDDNFIHDSGNMAFTDATDNNCPGKHGLSKFNSKGIKYICDRCNGIINRYKELWGCRICEYDLCPDCYFSAIAKVQRI